MEIEPVQLLPALWQSTSGLPAMAFERPVYLPLIPFSSVQPLTWTLLFSWPGQFSALPVSLPFCWSSWLPFSFSKILLMAKAG